MPVRLLGAAMSSVLAMLDLAWFGSQCWVKYTRISSGMAVSIVQPVASCMLCIHSATSFTAALLALRVLDLTDFCCISAAVARPVLYRFSQVFSVLLAQLWSGGGAGADGTHVGIMLVDAYWPAHGSSLEGVRKAKRCGGVKCRQSDVAASVPDWPQLPMVHAVSCSFLLAVGVRANADSLCQIRLTAMIHGQVSSA